MEACETCVDMTSANQDMLQDLIRLRKVSKMLRAVNSGLRDRISELQEQLIDKQEQMDSLFRSLCEEPVDMNDEIIFQEAVKEFEQMSVCV